MDVVWVHSNAAILFQRLRKNHVKQYRKMCYIDMYCYAYKKLPTLEV